MLVGFGSCVVKSPEWVIHVLRSCMGYIEVSHGPSLVATVKHDYNEHTENELMLTAK